ncbi:hypothetical protein [Butyrivibrio sp. AE2032]|nr:hypothetical protein [Butyrivibrio sp. AE2032]
MTRIAVVNDHKNIVPYSRAAHVTVFVNEDGELRVLSGNRTYCGG